MGGWRKQVYREKLELIDTKEDRYSLLSTTRKSLRERLLIPKPQLLLLVLEAYKKGSEGDEESGPQKREIEEKSQFQSVP